MFGSFKAVKVGKSTITIARPLANLPGDLADVIEWSFGCDTMIREIHRSVAAYTHACVHHSGICAREYPYAMGWWVLNRSNVNPWVRMVIWPGPLCGFRRWFPKSPAQMAGTLNLITKTSNPEGTFPWWQATWRLWRAEWTCEPSGVCSDDQTGEDLMVPAALVPLE